MTAVAQYRKSPNRNRGISVAERFLAFQDDPVRVARRLLGQRLVRRIGRQRLAGLIVEVEAYLGPKDRAAHTFGGRRTARNASMYLPGGHAYVYFTYGMHHCLNVVCGKDDEGVAVLIRALEPCEGVEAMSAHRPAARRVTDLCSGPAKLTQALAIDRELDGASLCRGRSLWIERVRRRTLPASQIAATPRIGVDYAGAWARKPLRFAIRGNPHLSQRVNPLS
jgi:DNA-3-methyladenine glycosylase